MSEEQCRKALEEARKTLESAGFPVLLEEGTLSSFFALDKEKVAFAYTAECSPNGYPEAYAGVKGLLDKLRELDCERREKFLVKLLELPAKYRVSVGVDEDIILVYFPPGDPATAYTYVGSTYALGASIAGWMTDAVEALEKGEEMPEFRPEEEAGAESESS